MKESSLITHANETIARYNRMLKCVPEANLSQLTVQGSQV